MSRPFLIIFLLQAAVAGSALAAGELAGFSWFSLGILGLVALTVMVHELRPVSRREALAPSRLVVAWVFTLLLPSILASVFFRERLLDNGYAVGLALGVLAFLPASNVATEASLSLRCRRFVCLLGLLGGGVWLVYSYRMNQRGGFLAASFLLVAALVLCRCWFRLRPWLIQVTHTLILLLVALPVADHFIKPHDRSETDLDPTNAAYSFEAATRNPEAYAHWHAHAMLEWYQACSTLFYTNGVPEILHQKLRPNVQCRFFRSQVSMNSLGFRGREISREKGNAYRIVALGESTTFGITLTLDDKPWPEWLEEMIRERLRPNRPVEVINAGVPGYNLEQNLYRLPSDILPLKPDLIISYHGLNGFKFIFPSLPEIAAREENTPKYYARPLTLLGDAEFKLRILSYQQSRVARLLFRRPECPRPMATRYARDYEQLIGTCLTNGIHLALANYSMAVNAQSDRKVVEFYQRTAPDLSWQMAANEVHSGIVQELTRQNPGVWFIDTHAGLDGEHDNFIDPVHFTPKGHQRMAETMFEALKDHLQEELLQTNAPGG